MTDPAGRLPLEGVRVLDLSRLLPGAFASSVLADLGATIDKLEDTGPGDYWRAFPPYAGSSFSASSPGDAHSPDRMNAVFVALNRGKRSISLDLKQASGVAAFLRLLPKYDVLLESFRPGTLERLGLGPNVLKHAAPNLIVASLTGFGQTGPDAKKPGHDLNFLARAGVLELAGPETGAPMHSPLQVADIGGALFSVIGILARLVGRAPGLVDVSLTESALAMSVFPLASALADSTRVRGNDTLTGGLAIYSSYVSKDGVRVSCGALEPKFWITFATDHGLPPTPTAFGTGAHQRELHESIARVFASKSAAEWREYSRTRDVCVEVASSPAEVISDAHFMARDVVKLVGSSFAFSTPGSGTSPRLAPAPAQGQHTRELLADHGFTSDEIGVLIDSGAARAT